MESQEKLTLYPSWFHSLHHFSEALEFVALLVAVQYTKGIRTCFVFPHSFNEVASRTWQLLVGFDHRIANGVGRLRWLAPTLHAIPLPSLGPDPSSILSSGACDEEAVRWSMGKCGRTGQAARREKAFNFDHI